MRNKPVLNLIILFLLFSIGGTKLLAQDTVCVRRLVLVSGSAFGEEAAHIAYVDNLLETIEEYEALGLTVEWNVLLFSCQRVGPFERVEHLIRTGLPPLWTCVASVELIICGPPHIIENL